MSLLLRRNALPEMQGLTRDQQKIVWRSSYFKAFREPFSWIGIANFFVIAMIGRSLAGEIGMLVGAVIGAVIMLQFHLRAARPYMAAVRQEQGYPPVPVGDGR